MNDHSSRNYVKRYDNTVAQCANITKYEYQIFTLLSYKTRLYTLTYKKNSYRPKFLVTFSHINLIKKESAYKMKFR